MIETKIICFNKHLEDIEKLKADVRNLYSRKTLLPEKIACILLLIVIVSFLIAALNSNFT